MPNEQESDPNEKTHMIRVILECTHEWIAERDVEFIDIAEDFEGRDVLTFKCPKCGETHKSLRYA